MSTGTSGVGLSVLALGLLGEPRRLSLRGVRYLADNVAQHVFGVGLAVCGLEGGSELRVFVAECGHAPV
jgi:hypothetical protein